jgi:hypothetical protein
MSCSSKRELVITILIIYTPFINVIYTIALEAEWLLFWAILVDFAFLIRYFNSTFSS